MFSHLLPGYLCKSSLCRRVSAIVHITTIVITGSLGLAITMNLDLMISIARKSGIGNSAYCKVFGSVIFDLKTKSSRLSITMTPDQKSSEHWLGEDVEDTVEGCLRIRRDEVPTFTDAPSDRI